MKYLPFAISSLCAFTLLAILWFFELPRINQAYAKGYQDGWKAGTNQPSALP